jgi:hypothetical protein
LGAPGIMQAIIAFMDGLDEVVKAENKSRQLFADG